MLVDMGGGTFLRFGQAQAKLSDLSLVAISHLHPDHVSDLPALLWLSHQARKDPLPIVGPSGNDVAPAFPVFLSRLFDEKSGAFQVLGPTMGGTQSKTGGGVRLDVGVVDVTKAEPSIVFDREGVTVTALGIPHGNLPALAYRVQTRDVSVVFSSDQTGTNPRVRRVRKGSESPGHASSNCRRCKQSSVTLHLPWSVAIAQDAGVGRLIVSHIGEFDLDAAIAELKKFYTGPLTVGADLQCTQVQ